MYPATTAQSAAAQSSATRRRVTDVRASLIAAAAGLTVGALLLLLASRAGGYFPEPRLEAGAVAFGLLAVLLVLHVPRTALSGPALLAVGSLAALTVWTGLSSHWSSTPDVALDDFQRDLLYIGLFGLGLVSAGSGRYSRHLVWGVLAVATAVIVAAVVGRLYPDGPPDAVEQAAQFRLGGSLRYWNALGALGALTLVLAVGLASGVRSHPVLRGLAATAAVPAGVAGYLSFSRGAWMAFFVGGVVLFAISPRRLGLLVSTVICGGALAIVLARLGALEALTGDPSRGAGRAAEGRSYAPLLAFVALGTGLLQGAVAWFRPHPDAIERLSFLGRRAALVVGTLALTAAGVVYLMHRDRAEGAAAARLDSADSWVSRQWRDFMTPGTFSASGSQRLTTTKGTRSDLFRVAIDGFEAHPLRGDGSGGFEVRFAHDRRVDETVRDAHSVYLETLGELGVVGELALIGLIGAIVWAATLARLRPRALSRSQSAPAAAALAVWATHSAVDWDWQVPAVTGLALVLAAALMPTGISGRRRAPDRSRFA